MGRDARHLFARSNEKGGFLFSLGGLQAPVPNKSGLLSGSFRKPSLFAGICIISKPTSCGEYLAAGSGSGVSEQQHVREEGSQTGGQG